MEILKKTLFREQNSFPALSVLKIESDWVVQEYQTVDMKSLKFIQSTLI